MKKYKTRIKTINGVVVPPWREDKMKKGKSITLEFTLTKRIPSKKNELIGVVDRSDAFKYLNTLPASITKKQAVTMLFKTFARIKNAPAYERWEQEAVDIFKAQLAKKQPTAAKKGIIFPVSHASIVTKYYWKGKYRRDNSNKVEGIMDALVKAKVIMDDSDRVVRDTSQKARDYSDEILESIIMIYVTIPIK